MDHSGATPSSGATANETAMDMIGRARGPITDDDIARASSDRDRDILIRRQQSRRRATALTYTELGRA